jgi:uncharacterized small protein (DUF1192 family)
MVCSLRLARECHHQCFLHINTISSSTGNSKIELASVQELERQLDGTRDEAARLQAQRAGLGDAAAARGKPEALARHRYRLRKLRPAGEQVADEARASPNARTFVLSSRDLAQPVAESAVTVSPTPQERSDSITDTASPCAH